MKKSLHDLVGRELKWTQPRAFEREYELKDGDEIVAALRFRSMLGSHATAQTADGEWTFKRVGFFRTWVSIRALGSDQEIAIFRNSTWSGGGTLELPDGRRLPANTNFWGSTYEFKSESGETLVRYHRLRGVVHFSSAVEISAAAAAMPELPWLVPLGWYLALKMQDDSTAGGATAAAAG